MKISAANISCLVFMFMANKLAVCTQLEIYFFSIFNAGILWEVTACRGTVLTVTFSKQKCPKHLFYCHLCLEILKRSYLFNCIYTNIYSGTSQLRPPMGLRPIGLNFEVVLFLNSVESLKVLNSLA